MIAAPLPDLSQSLQEHDLGYLQIIAEAWGRALDVPDARSALPRLAAFMLDRELLGEVIRELPAEAQAAFQDLCTQQGRLPWATFVRRYGALREMGAARRDREKPYLQPASPTEVLWYHGLIGRVFFDTKTVPQEFAYIPADLLALVPTNAASHQLPFGRPATPAERAATLPAGDHILDDACTLLTALRSGLPLAQAQQHWQAAAAVGSGYANFLMALLTAAGLIDQAGMPLPEPTRLFLEDERGAALAHLVRSWLDSRIVDELRLMPGLICEGEWQNNPLITRQAILELLRLAPGQDLDASLDPSRTAGEIPFVNLASFITAVHSQRPDFQRPAGDYDSWYLRQQETGEYLRGFENWPLVDGALLAFMISGPLHWLGLLDLAAGKESPDSALAFRFSAWASPLLGKGTSPVLSEENERWLARSDGKINAPRLSPRPARYQLARLTEWAGKDGDAYRYRISAAALERASQQELRASHLLILLRRHCAALPPALARALERWEGQGSETSLEKAVILRVKTPDLLKELRASRAARFFDDPLGPTTVLVKPGAVESVREILLEMGYLTEVEIGT